MVSVPDARTSGCQSLEAGDARDLEAELLDRARGRGDVDRLLLELLGLLGGRLLVVLELVLDVGEADRVELGVGDAGVLAGFEELGLAQLVLELRLAALERLVDGGGRRGQAALEDGEREADDEALLLLALLPRAASPGPSRRGRTR